MQLAGLMLKWEWNDAFDSCEEQAAKVRLSFYVTASEIGELKLN
jgi:hypothetical protein